MPDKRVVYFILAAILGFGSCRRAPQTDFRVFRLVDLLEAKNIVSSPFASGALDPADPAEFPREEPPAPRSRRPADP